MPIVTGLPDAEWGRGADDLRLEVRRFLAAELEAGTFTPTVDSWLTGFDPSFSTSLGDRGWLGMTWPTRYGGQDRPSLERFVVIEELLAAGAPVAAHWIADRQTGPLLLRFGSEEQRQKYLPRIARGEMYFAIGMSEADSGSDLASVRTRAIRSTSDLGWRVSGTKVWTSGAHRCHHMLTLVRTQAANNGKRHEGLSQMIIDLDSPGVEVRPIHLLTGEHHFNEVVLDDVWVGDENVVGNVGDGWMQVTSELAYERSGPERFLSTLPLISEFVRWATVSSDCVGGLSTQATLGQLVGRLWSIRQLSLRVAAALDEGQAPNLEAAMVKDAGTVLEQESIEEIRRAITSSCDERLTDLLERSVQQGPGFTLRGGTTEILRTIVARELSL